MKITDLPAYQKKERQPTVRHEIPRVSPSESLVGPDTISGLVRDVAPNTSASHWVTLWDDPLGRTIYHTDEFSKALSDAYDNNKPITVTTEKVRGRWEITKVEETR